MLLTTARTYRPFTGDHTHLYYADGALCRAAELGNFEIIQVLSAYGADFNKTTSLDEVAVHYATVAYRLLCIRMLGLRG